MLNSDVESCETLLLEYLSEIGITDIEKHSETGYNLLVDKKFDVDIECNADAVALSALIGDIPENYHTKVNLFRELGRVMLSFFYTSKLYIEVDDNRLIAVTNIASVRDKETLDSGISLFVSSIESICKLYEDVMNMEKFNKYEYQ